MRLRKLLPLVLLSGVASVTGCQLAVAPFVAAKQAAQSKKTISPNAQPKLKPLVDEATAAYQQQVMQRFAKADFSWIDAEAAKVRQNKDRLPGGYYKLRAVYKPLSEPPREEEASNGEWEDHIASLESWIKQNPRSITARVALAGAWTRYAWKARGSGYADTVSDAGAKAFEERLATASKVLDEASSLEARCPEWYVAALWVGIGQSWERTDFDRIFDAGVEIDPTYYYLYQAKATYLLPRWYGEEGESEKFAEESANKVGGHQGDIIFFAVYSQLLSLHNLTFMNTRQKARPRILDGFRSIEKLYGPAPHRLNEACYFAFGSPDRQMVAELFNRIGENYDPEVWRSKSNFMVFRDGALNRARAERETQAAQSSSKTK